MIRHLCTALIIVALSLVIAAPAHALALYPSPSKGATSTTIKAGGKKIGAVALTSTLHATEGAPAMSTLTASSSAAVAFRKKTSGSVVLRVDVYVNGARAFGSRCVRLATAAKPVSALSCRARGASPAFVGTEGTVRVVATLIAGATRGSGATTLTLTR